MHSRLYLDSLVRVSRRVSSNLTHAACTVRPHSAMHRTQFAGLAQTSERHRDVPHAKSRGITTTRFEPPAATMKERACATPLLDSRLPIPEQIRFEVLNLQRIQAH